MCPWFRNCIHFQFCVSLFVSSIMHFKPNLFALSVHLCVFVSVVVSSRCEFLHLCVCVCILNALILNTCFLINLNFLPVFSPWDLHWFFHFILQKNFSTNLVTYLWHLFMPKTLENTFLMFLTFPTIPLICHSLSYYFPAWLLF